MENQQQANKKSDDQFHQITNNEDILDLLDDLKGYEKDYESRKNKQEEEEKIQLEEAKSKKDEDERKEKIAAEIQAQLEKIKTWDTENIKKIEEERRLKEEKRKKQEMLKAKIQEELQKIRALEAIQFEKLKEEEEKRAKEKKAKEEQELQERKRKEEEEAQKLLKKKREEEAERKKLLEEMQAIQLAKKKEEEEKRQREENAQKAKIAVEIKLQLENIKNIEAKGEKTYKQSEQRKQIEIQKDQEVIKKRQLAEMHAQKMAKNKDLEKKIAHETLQEAIARRRGEKKQEEKCKEEEFKRQQKVEQEKIRLLKEEEERIRLMEEAKEEERRRKLLAEKLAKKEEDRKIVEEILSRKKAQEEEELRIKKEAEEIRMQNIEVNKKRALEEKKNSILNKFQQTVNEKPIEYERPKKKSINNPFAQKFEDLATNAENEERMKEEFLKKKKKAIRKSRDIIRRSRQMLKAMSKENIKKSCNLFKRLSKDSLNKINSKSTEKLKRCLSSEIKHSKSKLNLGSKEKFKSGEILVKSSEDTHMDKKGMQNYLISQVLFDGKEDVKSSRIIGLQNKKCETIKDEDEEEEREREKEEMRKAEEKRVIEERRRIELTIEIQKELEKMKKIEEEQKIKLEESQFEAYKIEMEKYLNFVCDEDKPEPKKKKKQKIKTEPKKKLNLNIGSLKSQFESQASAEVEDVSKSSVKSAPVRKLNPMKYVFEKQQEDKKVEVKNKKEYIPVIIDKDAFERTMGKFDYNKQEEEERKKNEERIRRKKEKLELERAKIEEEKRQRQLEIEKEQRRKEQIKEEKRKIEMNIEKINQSLNENLRKADPVIETPPPLPPPKKLSIQEQIQLELERIKIEEEKQKVEIEKERRKKELKRQIQNEIEKISSVDGTAKEDENDDTPTWIKMITDAQNRKIKQKEKQKIVGIVQNTAKNSVPESNEEDDNTPAWIKMIQTKLSAAGSVKKSLEPTQAVASEKSSEPIETGSSEKSSVFKDSPSKSRKQVENNVTCLNKEGEPKINLEVLKSYEGIGEGIEKLPIKKRNEPVATKSVASVKSQFEKKKNEEKEEVVMRRTKKEKVADRVKKVKSLFLESEAPSVKEKKSKHQATSVTRKKASSIKSMFENKHSENRTTKVEPPQRKRKCLVEMPMERVTQPEIKKKEEIQWKWKQKDMKDIYDYMNSNKELVPEILVKKAENLENIQNNINNSTVIDQYGEFITNVHSYLAQENEDKDECSFKSTIHAYLDLIEGDNERNEIRLKNNKAEHQKINKETLLMGSTIAIKEKLKREIYQNNSSQKSTDTFLVGKVDTTFLSKENDITLPKLTRSVTNENCSFLRLKYDQMNIDDGPKPTYTMEKKLIQVPDNIDSMAWKKQQRQQQWTYKQKSIAELQKLVFDNKKLMKDKEDKISQPTILNNANIPYLDKEKYADKIKEEEEKMQEFESFMDEIHDFLETDTVTEEENNFKWSIQVYLDLIEEEPLKPVQNDLSKLFTGDLDLAKPLTMNDRKEKLFAGSTIGKKSDEVIIAGNMDTSFLVKNEKDTAKINTDKLIHKNSLHKMKNQFENIGKPGEILEKSIVKKKIVQLPEKKDPNILPQKKVIEQQWKYKQKDIAQLQEFIRQNNKIAPKELLISNEISETETKPTCVNDLLEMSDGMKKKAIEKEKEFEEFMNDLHEFMDKPSETKEQAEFKDGISTYVSQVRKTGTKDTILPKLGSAIQIKDIKNQLSNEHSMEDAKKPNNTTTIGKVSHFFKKSANKEFESSLVKENLSALLQPGKAKGIKKSFEEKPKLTRSASEANISTNHAKKIVFKPLQQNTQQTNYYEENKVKAPVNNKWQAKLSSYFQSKACSNAESKRPIEKCEKIKQVKEEREKVICKSEWEDITDPVERKNAILAKHGFKPVKKVEDKEDIDDILNYEDSEECKQSEDFWKKQYGLDDDQSESDCYSSTESLHKNESKKSSFSSIMNILGAMKKANMSKTFSDSKAKLTEITNEQKVRRSLSDVDLSDIPGSCSNIKGYFESGEAFQQRLEPYPSMIDDDECAKAANTANMRSLWESHFTNTNDSNEKSDEVRKPINKGLSLKIKAILEDHFKDTSPHQAEKLNLDEIAIGSVPKFTNLFNNGELNKENINKFINEKSDTYEYNSTTYKRIQELFENGDGALEEEFFDGSMSVQSELEALRSSSKLKSMFRIERGNESSDRDKSGLKRTISCIGVSGEQNAYGDIDLDEEEILDLRTSNKKVREMFEASAPKYKFGGSGESLNKSKSDINENRKGPVMRPSSKPKESRAWVLDSINKFFDVIVEDEEEEEDDDQEIEDLSSPDDYNESSPESEDDNDTSDYESEYDEVDYSISTQKDPASVKFKSSTNIRGLLSSVVSNISKSRGNLACSTENLSKTQIMSNLKQNLGSKINLRKSKQDLSDV